ncbi:MAG: tRNA (adenosine(37)-N6)-threonylcarbamoyltransferase complex ATPase subunit type 1 TsaE [Lachnospiraceae bacterium]
MSLESVFESKNPEMTYEFAKKLAVSANAGDVFCLVGDLGVGKTLFSQGFAKGMGIEDYVNSPTFTIVQEYNDGRLPLYHFDVYRIEEPEEMEEIGYTEMLYGDGVCLIEWADLIEEIWPEHYTKIVIEKDLEKGFDFRRITTISV